MSLRQGDAGTSSQRTEPNMATSLAFCSCSNIQSGSRDFIVLPSHYSQRRCKFLLECATHAAHVESICGDQVDRVQENRKRKPLSAYMCGRGGTLPALAHAHHHCVSKHHRDGRFESEFGRLIQGWGRSGVASFSAVPIVFQHLTKKLHCASRVDWTGHGTILAGSGERDAGGLDQTCLHHQIQQHETCHLREIS